jgi:hypothetical protein
MQCPTCGSYVSEEDVFCGECGQPLAKVTQPAEPVSAEPQDQPAPKVILAPRSPRQAPARAARPAAQGRSPLVIILLLAGVALLLFCLFGAGLLLWLGSREESEPSPVPSVVLYEDDFGDPASGWDIYSEDDTWADYVEGEYGLGVNRVNYMAWGNPDLQEAFTDVEVEVDARQVEGPLDNNFGLLIRYQPDDESFYWFQISSDGYYSVDLTQADDWITLVDWETSDAIQQGVGASNHLKVVCQGDGFSFYVNGVYLTSVSDDTFGAGSIGLAVGTFDESGVQVHFDNLKVTAPQE